MHLPKVFETIQGQKRVITQIWQAYSQNRLPSSFIFFGQEGIGKFLFAKKLSQLLLCKENGCEHCQYCKWIQNDTHPDMKILSTSSTQGISTDAVKSFLQEMQLQPMYGNYRIGIVLHEDGNLNHFGQNALLKTLEEPSEHRMLIIIAQSVSTLLDTILSRCVTLQFQPIDDELIRKKANLIFPKYDEDTLSTIVLLSQGSFQRVLDFEEKSFRQIISQLRPWFIELKEFPPLVSKSIEALSKSREHAKTLLLYLLLISRAAYTENHISSNFAQKLWKDLAGVTPAYENLVTFSEYILSALEYIERNYSVRMTVEDLSIKARELFFSMPDYESPAAKI